jgi:hypothetical protein
MVTLGTEAGRTAVTSLAPSLAMPPASYFEPTMKPVMFCRKTSGIFRCAAQLDEVRALDCALSENRMPLLAMMPPGMPWMWAKPQTSVSP